MPSAQFETPQAQLPEWNPAGVSYSVPYARRNKINAPRQIPLDGPTLVFDARPGSNLGDQKVVSKLVIQNLSTNNMYIGVNQVAGSDVGEYHFLLPANSLGAQLDLSVDQPEFVSVFGTDDDLVSVYIAYPKESQP